MSLLLNLSALVKFIWSYCQPVSCSCSGNHVQQKFYKISEEVSDRYDFCQISIEFLSTLSKNRGKDVFRAL